MKPWYNNNDCERLSAYHAYYPVSTAAMLWCKVPYDEAQEELNRIRACYRSRVQIASHF